MRRRPHWPVLFTLAAVLAAGSPLEAQQVTLQLRDAGLQDAAAVLSRQTGYDFRVSLDKERLELRRDLDWKDRPLAEVIAGLGGLFRCDFLSVDLGGFYVYQPEPQDLKEIPVGPYRLRVRGPDETREPNVLRLDLLFAATDNPQMEAIAGLDEDFRILDNYGRSVLAPVTGIRRTTEPRERLHEFRSRLYLSLRDGYASRLRSVRGALLVYRHATPVRIELPLGDAPQTVERDGLRVALDRPQTHAPDVTVTSRLSWKGGDDPDGLDVIGQGISRTPAPYLVDANGRAYREWKLRYTRSHDPDGTVHLAQTTEFAAVLAPPAKLVYEVFVRREPTLRHPFHLEDLPLPGREDSQAPRERGAFYAAEGGTLGFEVRDAKGRPAEGQAVVSLARQVPGGWTGAHWLELPTDPAGRVRLERLQPGRYRVRRTFRFLPTEPPVPLQERILEVEVLPGKEAALPSLQLGTASPDGGEG